MCIRDSAGGGNPSVAPLPRTGTVDCPASSPHRPSSARVRSAGTSRTSSCASPSWSTSTSSSSSPSSTRVGAAGHVLLAELRELVPVDPRLERHDAVPVNPHLEQHDAIDHDPGASSSRRSRSTSWSCPWCSSQGPRCGSDPARRAGRAAPAPRAGRHRAPPGPASRTAWSTTRTRENEADPHVVDSNGTSAVSYTHLTLPTSDLV